MTDIRLISILPPPVVGQSSGISQGAGGTVGVFINFPVSSILSGFILNRDTLGNPILRTEAGDIAFQSNLFLKIGAEVVIKVVNRGGSTLAQILTVDGETPEATSPARPVISADGVPVNTKSAAFTPPPQPAYSPASSGTVAPTTASPAALPSNSSTHIVSGIVLTPPAAPDAPVPAPVPLRIVTLQAPPASLDPPPQTPAAATSQAPYNAYTRASLTQPPSTPSATTPAPVGTPPPVATTPPQPLTVGQIITVPVIAQEPTGESLVQTPAGIIRLQNTSLLTGSTVTLEVLPKPAGQTASLSTPLSLPPAPVTELARHWVSLEQIATLLADRPQATPLPWLPLIQTTGNATVQAAHKPALTSGLLVFITALRGGDFRNWLGEDNARWLEQTGHEPILRKATAEFAGMARLFTEVTPQSVQPWQSLFFPVAVDNQLQQIRIFYKRERRKDEKRKATPGHDSRFVVEITLSRMGELQLDGFVRREAKTVQFDLFIRSLSPLEEEIQRDLQRIYSDIGDITGYRGTLVFQAVREFPVNPMKDIANHQTGSIQA